jgi:hypothetical protein
MPVPETCFVTTSRTATIAFAATAAAVLSPGAALAQRFENQVAIFAALDKVTARISRLEVELNKTTTFGSLKVTPRACYSRAADEPPKTTTFVEVEETMLDGQQKRIFTGWMFAESPGLNAVEHPIFDVWLTGCAQPTASRPTAKGSQTGQQGDTTEEGTRRRVRR